MSETLSLIRLAAEHRLLLLSMIEDFKFAEENLFSQRILDLIQSDFDAFLKQLRDSEVERRLPEGRVPQSVLWLMQNRSVLLGLINLRHRLTQSLEHHGGHIGYFIRPSEREKGYGTRMLILALDEARKLGLSQVLMTCNTDNLSSARGIEKNGGVLASQGISDVSGKLISRYWITL